VRRVFELNPSRKIFPTSIVTYTDNAIRRALIASVLIVTVVLMTMGLAFVSRQTVNEHSNLISAVSINFEMASQLGDAFQMEKLSHSLLESQALAGIDIKVDDVSVLEMGIFKNYFAEYRESGFYVHDGSLFHFLMTEQMPRSAGGQRLRLWTARQVPLGSLGTLLFGEILTIVLIGLYLRTRLKGLGLELVTPIRELSAAVSGTEQTASTRFLTVTELASIWNSHQEYLATREKHLQEIQKLRVSEAIALTTQMLAHDVRKPFSMIRMAMDSIRSTDSLAAAHRVTETMLPEVEQAMLSVNGLIEDVMEFGSSGIIILEESDSVTLVQRCIDEAIRVHAKAEFTLERTWNHSNLVRCNEHKIARVFSNIVSNAIQAIPSGERLWIRTRNVQVAGANFVEFVIGNGGSFIDSESLPKLFEAFFTKNKKGGTGLGLAIAHKIITSHGGEITCRSERNDAFPDGMVEFTFTLPAGVPVERTAQNSLMTSNILRAAFKAESTPVAAEFLCADHFIEDERRLEAEVERCLSGSSRLLEVLIVDDEKLYREGLRNQLGVSSSLQSLMNVSLCENVDEAMNLVSGKAVLDLAILDVDLGSAQVNGFDLAISIRSRFPACIVCIHSNRNLASDHRTAIEHGADTFHPKPMVRPHLLKLLLQAGENVPCSSQRKFVDHARRIAVVDDSMGVQLSWEMKLGTENADFFSSPEEFFAHATAKAGYLESLLCVISDFHFGNESPETGVTFAESLRAVSNVVFLLSSNHQFQNGDLGKPVTGVISKTPLGRNALVEIINAFQKPTVEQASQ